MTGTRLSRRRLHEFLATFAWDQYYFPMDGPFQNYSYFKPMGLDEVKGCWRKTLRLIREGRAPREVGVYLHWPFCPSQCTYCYCSMCVPQAGGWAASYAAMLKREMDEFRGIFEGTRFGSVWLGGGTPTYMPQEELDGLLAHLRESFELEPGAQVYVESSPATLTAGKMEVLARHGVNRMTLGVQSLDEGVLKRIDRAGQTRETVERAWELIKRWPGILTDVDVMFGLEGQSAVSFVRDLGWAVGKDPDAIHLYGFEPRAQTLFARGGGRLPEERRAEARRTVAAAERLLTSAGYRTARVDAQRGADLPEERQDSAVRRLGASVLGLGHSAISHAFGSAWYYHPLVPHAERISRAIPAFRAMHSGLQEEMRGYALRHLGLYHRLSRRAFANLFGRDLLEERSLAAAFRDMEADGLVRVTESEVVSTCRDEIKSLIGLKRLYSPRVVSALLQGRCRALERFRRHPARPMDGAWSPQTVRKIADRGLFRVYFKGPTPAGHLSPSRTRTSPERLRLYRFLGLLARSEDYPPKDGPFQNYSYFKPKGLDEVKGCWRKTLRLMRAGRAPREVGVYLHWPFCPSQCTYCYCSMCVPKAGGWAASYAAMLKREMDEFRGIFEGTRFGSVWLGGGTPTYMPQEELDGLLAHLRESFELEPGAQVYVESSPATLTAGKMEVLARHGVNRMTLGVQSLDEGVLKRIDRAGQTRETVERAWELIKRWPGILTDVDVMFGLEGQSAVSFVRDLGWAVGKGPDAIHLYGFEPRAQTLFARGGGRLPEARRAEARRTVAAAERLLTSAGYRTARVDAQRGADLPEERQDSAVRRLGASVLGLGYTAKSHAFGSAWYEHRPVPADGVFVTAGVPPYFALPTDENEEARGLVIRHLCIFGAVSRPLFRERFGRDLLDLPALAAGLAELEASGKIRVTADSVISLMSDAAERSVWLKALYSEPVIAGLLKLHAQAHARFIADEAALGASLEDKAETRARFLIYYRDPKLKTPAPALRRASALP